MNPEAGADVTPTLDPAVGLDEDALPSAARHRRHRFPARDKVVKVRYDEREHAVLAAAAGRAGLTVAGFLAGAGLSAAGQRPPPSQAADRELLGELLRLRSDIRRYAVTRQACAMPLPADDEHLQPRRGGAEQRGRAAHGRCLVGQPECGGGQGRP